MASVQAPAVVQGQQQGASVQAPAVVQGQHQLPQVFQDINTLFNEKFQFFTLW